ncbi:unnamed protein product [Urochloa decumbens]|uniref:Uncharacterized protein n=1 Tax=Urochloa decumbens TaxID=240449 RepID=A0ABC8Z0C5_9POAL
MEPLQSEQAAPLYTYTEIASMAENQAIDVNQETGDTMVGGDRPTEPCLWGDFFATYGPPPSLRSEEWMRERAGQIKEEVREIFASSEAMRLADMLSLVDTLERLSIDNHFHKEINAALSRIHDEEQEFCSSSDLHIVALRFCLLRQHGFWVSKDVFDTFKDGTGSFSTDLSSDPRGLLSLYNAAHMAVPGETILDDAIAFARHHLEAAKGKLGSPMAEQVCRALKIPRPRFMQRLETMHYITEYEQEEKHNTTVLELARLDFNLVRSLHLKELRNLSVWWRDLYDDVKLTYSRDRIIETYFYTIGVFHQEDNHRARIILTKVFRFLSLMDDTYDSHATFKECQILNEAIQRWDENMVSILPEYLRMLYIKILSNFNEIEDTLEPYEKYRMAYMQKMFKLQSKSYLEEAKWFDEKYIPSFKEHVGVSVMSAGLPMLFLVALIGAGQVATKETLDWALDIPDMVHACAENGRFLNGIASYKLGKSKRDVASSFECYMKEHGMTAEDAIAAFAKMVEHAWRRINRACIELDHGILPAAQIVVNMTRTLETLYHGGTDAYTFSGNLKEIVTSLFLKDLDLPL